MSSVLLEESQIQVIKLKKEYLYNLTRYSRIVKLYKCVGAGERKNIYFATRSNNMYFLSSIGNYINLAIDVIPDITGLNH